jgi:hypothetical protein
MTYDAHAAAREAWKKWLDALFEGHVEPSEPQPKWLAAMVPLFQAAHDADRPTPSTTTPIPAAEARHAYGVVAAAVPAQSASRAEVRNIRNSLRRILAPWLSGEVSAEQWCAEVDRWMEKAE